MAISDKLNFLIETKSQLKDMINYGLPTENQITNETTFRNYVKGIFEAFIESLRDSTTLYTNLPKISGNGTQITLNDTANAPMRITLNPSALSQDATPTPSSPQDIHTISGDNSVVVNGKNFARVDDTNISATGYTLTTSKGLITITTTETNNSIDLCKGIRTGVYLPNYANANDYHLTSANQETYKLSISNVTADITGTANQIIEIFTNQRQIQPYITPAGSLLGTTSFTLQENEYVKSIYMWTNGATTINKLQFNIQLEKGSTATTYTPYTSNTQTINLYGNSVISSTILSAILNDAGKLASSDTNKTMICHCEPNTKYAIRKQAGTRFRVAEFSSEPSLGDNCSNRIKDDTGTYISYTTSNTTNYLAITFWATGDTITEAQMLETLKVNEDIGLEYCKIGNYEDEFILTSGKNEFDKDNANVISAYFRDTALNQLVVNSSNSNKTIIYKGEPNTTYTISKTLGNRFRVGLYNSMLSANGTYYFDTNAIRDDEATSITITTTSTNYYIYVQIFETGDLQKTLDTIMINEGTTALPYEPYGTNQWYLKKNIGKVVLDGSESWLMSITSRFYISLDRLTGNTLGLCNYFENKPSLSTNNGITFYQTNQNIYIYYDGCTTTSDFKTWLSTHNTIVYYILATPIYTKITGTLETQLNNIYKNMLSYKGTTNISQVNNDLPFVLGVSAIQDLE